MKIEQTPAGGWLIDMGKNFTGWLELRLPANIAAGKNLKIEFADDPPTGNRYATFNQRDEYVTRAGAGQTVRSRFNYHAFRYAHVTGLDQAPAMADIKADFIRTSYARAGQFESSNELLNRIYRLVTWTYQCLTLGGYVVDCPTRERLGYGGDAGTSIETGCSTSIPADSIAAGRPTGGTHRTRNRATCRTPRRTTRTRAAASPCGAASW